MFKKECNNNIVTSDKILYGFTLIMAIYAVSIWLVQSLGLLLPPPLLGMIILAILLLKNIIKAEKIKDVSFMLLDYMGMLFIPPAISLMMYVDIISKELLPLIFTIILSAIAVMVVTGKIVQMMLGRDK